MELLLLLLKNEEQVTTTSSSGVGIGVSGGYPGFTVDILGIMADLIIITGRHMLMDLIMIPLEVIFQSPLQPVLLLHMF